MRRHKLQKLLVNHMCNIWYRNVFSKKSTVQFLILDVADICVLKKNPLMHASQVAG